MIQPISQLSQVSGKTVKTIIWIGVLAFIAYLTLNRQQHYGTYNWRATLWADQAGYYVYSPALFIYGFDGSQFPENLEEKTGEGFSVDENGKIITRYTSGVAIMQAPIFLMIHGIASLTGQNQDGFSGIYHLVPTLATILYVFFGLFFLWQFLQYYFKRTVAFFTLVTLFAGTNLLFYTIDVTGMSHSYSFFLFSLLLWLSKRFFLESETQGKRYSFFLLSLVAGLIVLVRPTNLVFVGLVFILDVSSRKQLVERIQKVMTLNNLLILFVALFLVFLPQMLYWKYSSGEFVTDSYEGYGFTNWKSPQILKFLFSTNNGLFPYNPIYFVILFGLFYMIWRRKANGYYIFVVFAGLVYLFSSWFVYSFGCSFGSRNFVEYTAIFALPLAYFYQQVVYRIKWLFIVPLVLVLINIKLVCAYDKCFGGGEWDWSEYAYFLKVNKYRQTYRYIPPLVLGPEIEYSPAKRIKMDRVTRANYRRAMIETSFQAFDDSLDAVIVLQIETPDSILYWNGIKLLDEEVVRQPGKKIKTKAFFGLPKNYSTDAVVSTFVWNIGKDSLNVSKIQVHLE